MPHNNSPLQRWHSGDFLVRIARGERPDDDPTPGHYATPAVAGRLDVPTTSSFATRSAAAFLTGLPADPDLYEHHALLRSPALTTAQLTSFGARNKSVWALDALAGRLTGDRHDWSSLRATVLLCDEAPEAFEPTLDPIALEDLYSLARVLHDGAFDLETERALLRFIALRMLRGGELETTDLETFLTRLLGAGLGAEAGALFPGLSTQTWRRYAIAAELRHPRFGGSLDATLARLNEAYYRLGLERLRLDGAAETPFERLAAAAATPAAVGGPLVTVIITSHRPGPELQTAVRSIVAQSYQDWELIVVEDDSPEEYRPVLDAVATFDPRIRVIRGETGGGPGIGPYARRNEAIQLARGELVTMQDPDGWSHPRRIELQVRDLLAVPTRLANLITGARATDEFSLFTPCGADLVEVQSSILFRRDAVVDAIGYFDSAHGGAELEFRRRLETVTRMPVHAIATEVPLVFVRTESGSAPVQDGTATWSEQELMAYHSSVHRFHEQILAGRQAPQLPPAQGERMIAAPPRLLGTEPIPRPVDLLLVVDGRKPSWREKFIDVVVDEIRTALSAGLRVALLHSESATGMLSGAPLPYALQSLIDSGRLLQVFDQDPVEATVVVVRHAGAAQGHPARRRPITATRVVVVEDPSGGDERGGTVARPDVCATVSAWFGVQPRWIPVRPTPSKPNIKSVVVDRDMVLVRLQSPDLASISAVRIGRPDAFVDLELTPGEDAGGRFRLAAGPVDELPAGELSIAVVRQIDGGPPAVQTCQVPPRSVLTVPGRRLLVSTGDSGGLRMLSDTPGPDASGADASGAADFYQRYLDAEVSLVKVFRNLVGVTVAGRNVAGLVALSALRIVNGRIRRRDFILEPATDGQVRARHSVASIADVRWQIYGLFQTPVGLVEMPIRVTADTAVENSDRYRVRVLAERGVVQVVPQRVDPQSDRVPGLSVIMPVYNVGPYLDTAIRSVLTQDFDDLELIIIDDASSDNGRRIMEMHRELDPRIRVIELDHNTLGGAGIPSNLGIRAARGKYIAFVDSDDWVSKTGLNQLVVLAERHDAEIAIGDFQLFNDDDRQLDPPLDSAAWLDLPVDEVISAVSHPALLRLSPVPWRKLYRRDFVQAHRIRFPEGDLFYEDNVLHWLVLSRAERVVASDEIVAYHRMQREGQTMAADLYKFGAIASHANAIVNALDEVRDDRRGPLFEAFIQYLRRQNWTVRRQTQPAAAALMKRRFAGAYEKAIAAAPGAPVRAEIRRHFEEFRDAYPDLDLTVVIPVFDSEDLIRDTLDSVLRLTGLGLSYNVLLVDDGSTDSSLTVIREYEDIYDHVHVFTQRNRGAGRARNSVIPLVTGRYTYFLDADDVVDAGALARAVAHADSEAADLVFLKYRIEYFDEGRSRGMFNADTEIWNRILECDDAAERQRLIVGLINYPWNRLIRTSLLHDAGIFFGPTVVHNDMVFHWHGTLSARTISFLDAEVCIHRKFDSRTQVTNIVDERRMVVVEALRGTYERICELPSYPNVREEWIRFAVDLLDWAKDRIPASLRETYVQRGERFIQAVFEEAAQSADGQQPLQPDGVVRVDQNTPTTISVPA
ncbi:glycosyltransferase family 2 protein [Microlunatus endophyticus]